MIAPPHEEPSHSTNTSFKSKHTNMEKLMSMENLTEFSLYELRIIMIILFQKGRKNKVEDAEENQTFTLSLKQSKNVFTNPNLYYAAIKRLTEIGLIEKVEGKQSSYRANPAIISNLTQDQSISLGLKKDYPKRK